MTKPIINFITGIFFAGLLIGTAIMQTHLKDLPLVLMLIFGAMTLTAYLLRQESNSTMFFYFLLGTMFFINYFMLTDLFVNWLYPAKGIELNGKIYRTMNMNWVWGLIIGFVLAIGTLVLYYKINRRSRTLEIGTTILFLTTTLIIYLF